MNLKYLPDIIGKLKAEGAKDVSDAELVRCLSGCVMPNTMIALARAFVASGDLTNESLGTAVSGQED